MSASAPKIEFRGDHVHVELGPIVEVEPDKRREFWTLLRSICDEHGTRRVFVEGPAPEIDMPPDQVADAGAQTAVIPHLWLAFCFEGFEASESSELFAVVAASKGVRVRFFTEAEAALRWLRSNAPG